MPASGTIYSKVIKECFSAPKGWLFVGSDFLSLEDKISALLTKDPNKLAIYEDGLCGHCLRSYYYFKDQMPDISWAEDTDKCYKINDNIYIKEDDIINYQGKTYKGKDLVKELNLI